MLSVSHIHIHIDIIRENIILLFLYFSLFLSVVSCLLSSPGRGAFLRTDDLAVSFHMVAVKSGQLSAP